MLRNKTPDAEIKVYELYLERLKHHLELRLRHMTIYSGFNTALVAVCGFLLRSGEGGTSLDVSRIWLPCLAGIPLSVAWWLVTLDDRRWQDNIGDVIRIVELTLFDEPPTQLMTTLGAIDNARPRWKPDVVDVNVYTAWFFVVLWVTMFVVSGLYAL